MDFLVEIVLILLGVGTSPTDEPDPATTTGEGGDTVRKSPIG